MCKVVGMQWGCSVRGVGQRLETEDSELIESSAKKKEKTNKQKFKNSDRFS